MLEQPRICAKNCYASTALSNPLAGAWDRLSTYIQYQGQANWRRAKNPGQTVWDFVSGTIFIEEASAFEAILIEDGELLNRGQFCGVEMECITGVSVVPGQDALATGHLVRFGGNNPSPQLVAHEAQHVFDIESVAVSVSMFRTRLAAGATGNVVVTVFKRISQPFSPAVSVGGSSGELPGWLCSHRLGSGGFVGCLRWFCAGCLSGGWRCCSPESL